MITNLKRPTAQIKLITAVFLFFAVIILSFGRETGQLRQDKLLADVYFRNALDEYNKGSFNSAGTLVDISISFYSDFSDSHYLKSLLFFRIKHFSAALAEVKTALFIGNWNSFCPIDGHLLSAKINLESGDPAAAYMDLMPYESSADLNKAIAEIYVPAAAYSGHVEEALKVSRLFPMDNFAQKVLARYDRGWRNEARARIMSGDNTDLYTKEAVRILINSIDLSLCSGFLSYYRKRWGADRFYLINSLCIDTADAENILDTIFTSTDAVRRDEIFRIKKILDYKNADYDARSYFRDKNFTVTDDLNGDGLCDVESRIEAGVVKSVQFDRNHDGVPEYSVEFAEGKVVSVKISDGDKTICAEYLPYPYLVRYTVNDGNVEREYSLIPYMIKLPVVIPAENPFLDSPSVNRYVSLPGSMTLETMSSKIEERNMAGDTVVEAERTSLAGTYMVFKGRDGVVLKKREYDGRRLIKEDDDIDHDGKTEVAYVFDKGKLVSASFDLNHNGKAEYREIYLPDRINEWDFNEDGIYDYREYTSGNVKISEYSSKLDGIFDIRLENRENE